MLITPCRNCRQKPEVIETGDSEFPFVLKHKDKDLCYPAYKLETHQHTAKVCIQEWNEFNKG